MTKTNFEIDNRSILSLALTGAINIRMALDEKIEEIKALIDAPVSDDPSARATRPTRKTSTVPRKHLSASGRAAISLAQKKRWAKARAAKQTAAALAKKGAAKK